MAFPKLDKSEALQSFNAVDPQLQNLFYSSDEECGESVASAGPPPPEEEEIILKSASPERRAEIESEIESELAYEQMYGQSYEASVDALTPLQAQIQKIGKAARQQQDDQAGRVSAELLAKVSEKLHRHIGIDANGDLLEKRVSTAPDVDKAEFLATWEDPSTPAGRLVDRLIDEDNPAITTFLRAHRREDRATMETLVPIILAKS